MAFSDRVNIISSEAFYSTSTLKHEGESIPEKLRALLPKDRKIKVIVYLRDYFDFIYSLYCQYVKLHAHNQFITEDLESFTKTYLLHGYFNYSTILGYWEDAFGAENLIVKKYSKQRNNLVNDFFHELKINHQVQDSNKENVGLSRVAIEVKRLLNALPLDNKYKLHAIQPVLKSLSDKYNERFATFSEKFSKEVSHFLSEDKQTIENKYRISLSLDVMRKNKDKKFELINPDALQYFIYLVHQESRELYTELTSAILKGLHSQEPSTIYAAKLFEKGFLCYKEDL